MNVLTMMNMLWLFVLIMTNTLWLQKYEIVLITPNNSSKKCEASSVLKTVTAKVFLDSLGVVPEKPYFCSTREKTIRKQAVTYGYLY